MKTVAKIKPDIEEIAERITTAVMEQRLPPGIKLAEERLASVFGVSRTKIRQALMVLSKDGLIKLHPNRGAFVASPSIKEAQDLFATRRLVEPEVIRNVVANANKAGMRRLRAHISLEAEARRSQDRRAIIMLSGVFHMLLAELAGNSFIEKLMSELCPLTCLIIALYDAPQTPSCPEGEHVHIVNAIESKDTATAIELMLQHLHHVESELRLGVERKPDVDWERMFG
jgi:DNA-binding GntR family transcriptional regulator